MPKKVIFSTEDVQNIISLYNNEKVSRRNLAKKYHTRIERITKLLNEKNIKIRSIWETQKIIFNKEQTKDIINLYEKGTSAKIIGKKYSLCTQTILKELKNNNIKVKRFGIERLTKKDHDDIHQLYLKGQSTKELGKKYKINTAEIIRCLHQYNISLDPHRDRIDYYRKYTINENYFNKVDTHNKAYVLGLITADGNIPKNLYSLTIALQERDQEILKKIHKDMGSNKPLYFRKKVKEHHQNQKIFHVTSSKLIENLKKYGLGPKKAHTVQFPKKLDKQFYNSYILGVWDGDGTWGIYKNRAKTALVGNKFMLLEIQKILKKEINTNSYLYKKGTNNITASLNITTHDRVEKFIKWLYKDIFNNNLDFYIKRKYNKILEVLKHIENKNR